MNLRKAMNDLKYVLEPARKAAQWETHSGGKRDKRGQGNEWNHLTQTRVRCAGWRDIRSRDARLSTPHIRHRIARTPCKTFRWTERRLIWKREHVRPEGI